MLHHHFKCFESYLRIFGGSDQKRIQLTLKQNYSFFITYKIPLGIYINKDFSEVVYTIGDH